MFYSQAVCAALVGRSDTEIHLAMVKKLTSPVYLKRKRQRQRYSAIKYLTKQIQLDELKASFDEKITNGSIKKNTSSKMGNWYSEHKRTRGTENSPSTSRSSTQEQLEKADAELKMLKKTVEELETKNKLLQTKEKETQQNYHNLEAKLKAVHETAVNAQDHNRKLEDSLVAAHKTLEKTQEDCRTLEATLTAVRKTAENAQDHNRKLEDSLVAARKTSEKTQEDCRTLETKVVRKTAENAQDHNRKLEDRFDAAHKTLEETQQDYRTLESSLNTVHEMMEKTQEEYHILRAAKKKQDYCKLQASLSATRKTAKFTHNLDASVDAAQNTLEKMQQGRHHCKAGLDPIQNAAKMTRQDQHQPTANLDPSSSTQLLKKTNQEDKMNATHETAENAQNDYRKLEGSLETALETLEKTRQECRSLGRSLDAAQKALEEAQQDYSQNTTLVEIKHALRIDKRMTENISERCRPSAIARKYRHLENQEWLDAKVAVEDAKVAVEGDTEMDEEEINQFLCSALMTTYKASRDMYQCLVIVVSELIRRPALAIGIVRDMNLITPIVRDMGLIKPRLTDEITDAILTRLRQTCNSCDFGEFLKIHERDFSDVTGVIRFDAVKKYLHASAQLTWQMAIQQPPMEMSVTDGRFDENRHRLWHTCKKEHASNISHFVWPVLYDYEGGNLMVKGCVVAC